MANKEYRIVFEDETESGIESPVARNKNAPSGTEDSSATQSISKALKGYAALNYAISVGDKLTMSTINTVELRTGHQELQQKMQFAYGTAKQGVKIVSNAVAGGLASGSWVGAVVGAVLGVADSVINLAIKQNEINMRREVEGQTLYLNRIRAGASQDRTGKTQ
jgi:hypothetical protein